MSAFEAAILRLLTIVLIPVVAGLSLYTKILWTSYTDADVWENGYVPPRYVYSLIEETTKATVAVECSAETGSGFSFNFDKFDEAEFLFEWADVEQSSIILTNFHVIEDCYNGDSQIVVIDYEGKEFVGQVKAVDIENDVAALMIPTKIDPLVSAYYFYRPGYWVMAVGSPYGMRGTTTFGNVIFTQGTRIYTSASLNRGNSGGPLVDNVGLVMGINTGFQAVAQNLNYATDINVLCEKIANCFSKSKLIHPIVDE